METAVPSPELTPDTVLTQVLAALEHNDEPWQDAGIEVLYHFTSERMRSKVGDLAAFKRSLHNDLFVPLLTFDEVVQEPLEIIDATARQVIIVRSSQGRVPYVIALAVATYGEHQGCWLITGLTRGDLPLS